MTKTTNPDTSRSKELDALDLMILSVYKPDNLLRMEAAENDCLKELLDIREVILNSLHDWRKDIENLEN